MSAAGRNVRSWASMMPLMGIWCRWVSSSSCAPVENAYGEAASLSAVAVCSPSVTMKPPPTE